VALQTYHDAHRTLPSGFIFSGLPSVPSVPFSVKGRQRLVDAPPPGILLQPNGPGWGWAALLLPYLEASALHAAIDFKLAVEHVQQADTRTTELPYLGCPSDTGTGVYTVLDETNQPLAQAATNSYAACFGAFGLINTDPDQGNGLFQRNSRIRYSEIHDGLAQTIAVGERSALFAKGPWAGVMTGGTVRTTTGAPVYTAIVELAPGMVMARMGNRSLNSPYSEPYDFFSPHPDLVFFAFADGSVRSLTSQTDLNTLHALATRAEGDVPTGE
jgi:hypothetical protein